MTGAMGSGSTRSTTACDSAIPFGDRRRNVISLVTAPGDGEVTVVGDETMGE
jgi:hypothetical protein